MKHRHKIGHRWIWLHKDHEHLDEIIKEENNEVLFRVLKVFGKNSSCYVGETWIKFRLEKDSGWKFLPNQDNPQNEG